MRAAIFVSAAALATSIGLTGCDRPAATQASAEVAVPEIRSAVATQLNVAFQQQEAMLCVPTPASMVMKYYGDWEPPRKLKTLSRGDAYDPAKPFSDFTVTWYKDLVRGAETLGYSWAERDYPDDASGFADGLATIKTELVAGHPVLVDVSAPLGHTVVAAGFDEANRALFVVDPNSDAPGRYSISYDHFQEIWNEHAFDNRTRSLVLTSPHLA